MTDIAATLRAPDHVVTAAEKPKLDAPSNPIVLILFFGFLAAGILYMAYSVYVDVDAAGAQATTYLPYLLLFVALLIALGFEFVNGFHDTANAVATVNCASTTLGTANVTCITSSSKNRPSAVWNRISSPRPITSGGSTIGMSSTASSSALPRNSQRDIR